MKLENIYDFFYDYNFQWELRNGIGQKASQTAMVGQNLCNWAKLVV